jgi:PspAB-like protein
MGLLDTLLGRTQQAKPDLDALFALPSAAVTLQAAADLRPTGIGSVCVKPAEGGAFEGLTDQIEELLAVNAADGNRKYDETTDSYGFQWLTRRTSPDDLAGLVTDLHAVNSTLDSAGFGTALLCTLVGFTDGKAPTIGLVYLYKRGTWYPFAPTGETKRDNSREMQVRAMLGDDLKVEPDLSRWFPVWGAPGL